jgi:hypothetical protein
MTASAVSAPCRSGEATAALPAQAAGEIARRRTAKSVETDAWEMKRVMGE